MYRYSLKIEFWRFHEGITKYLTFNIPLLHRIIWFQDLDIFPQLCSNFGNNKSSWISRMGQNFDDYPGFQPKITHPKHFCPQCMNQIFIDFTGKK